MLLSADSISNQAQICYYEVSTGANHENHMKQRYHHIDSVRTASKLSQDADAAAAAAS